MTHEEKIQYMQIVARFNRFGVDDKDMDYLISGYELVMKKKGKTDLHDMVTLRVECEEREKERITAKELKKVQAEQIAKEIAVYKAQDKAKKKKGKS